MYCSVQEAGVSPSYVDLNSHTGIQGTMFTSVVIMRYLYHEVIREFYRITNSYAILHTRNTVLQFTIQQMCKLHMGLKNINYPPTEH